MCVTALHLLTPSPTRPHPYPRLLPHAHPASCVKVGGRGSPFRCRFAQGEGVAGFPPALPTPALPSPFICVQHFVVTNSKDPDLSKLWIDLSKCQARLQPTASACAQANMRARADAYPVSQTYTHLLTSPSHPVTAAGAVSSQATNPSAYAGKSCACS